MRSDKLILIKEKGNRRIEEIKKILYDPKK